MEKRPEITKAMVKMVGLWQRGKQIECYREFFMLEYDDRRLVESAFGKAKSQWPDRKLRAVAKSIYKMIRKKHDVEATKQTLLLEKLLLYWLNDGKEIFFMHYSALGKCERDAIIGAITEVWGEDEYAQIRQVSTEIRQFLQEKGEIKQ